MPGDLQKALSLIDAAHAEDPTTITIDGAAVPYELHYAQKCTAYLTRRLAHRAAPPSDALQLAVRAQHLRRWEVPRADYPMNRVGYYKWRTLLKERQGNMAAQICLDCGYEKEEAYRVGSLIMKEDLKIGDEDTQALEDVACCVFLDDQFAAFEKDHDEEKVVGILRKTWGKMTKVGQDMALEIHMEGRPKELVEKALSGGGA